MKALPRSIAAAILIAGLSIPAGSGCSGPARDSSPDEVSRTRGADPVGVTFHWDTLERKGTRGDNW
jgi:hypothetical protein